ncbi:hypothetical protein [Streptomyces sp. NBC_01314]|uniref:hypothetical protein n=1 Tax=Streptomyces sp. NBC_01314 TaxID=2903821 RepID=UPI003089D0E3|nr:hypothetical protein OG622_15750 [Streptomyces sp. NBC_01314]
MPSGSSVPSGTTPDSPDSLAALTLGRWRSFEPATARRVAREAADLVRGRLIGVETVEHLGGPLHRVRIERDGQEFALIPGGRVTLGFDPETWRPTAEQAADYAASQKQGFGYGADLREHLAHMLSPRRDVLLATVLMAVEGERLTEPPADLPAVLAERGLRVPTSDEWEHACGAGADTLFRWGDDCPLDRVPYGDRTGPHNEPNAFGLRIAHDTYSTELTSDTGEVRGGDGGESVCGGYGHLLAWLPLATAHTHPDLAEFVYGEDGDGLYDDFTVRPVLPLGRTAGHAVTAGRA